MICVFLHNFWVFETFEDVIIINITLIFISDNSLFSELFYLRHFYISFKVFLKFWFVLVFWHNFWVFETFEDVIINITLILIIILFNFLDLRPPNMIFWMFRIVGLGCTLPHCLCQPKVCVTLICMTYFVICDQDEMIHGLIELF